MTPSPAFIPRHVLLAFAVAFPFLAVGPSATRGADATNAAAEAAREERSMDLAGRKAKQPWLWQTPRRQPIPSPSAAPTGASDIDRFLLARLEARGIAPAPPTDDHTWLRRVHFVVTGLPPSPEAATAFAHDRSPGKRERVVNGLLASPHYGERWARHWMDLVRYAESRGHESDFRIPNAWHYRDYLIRAFNADVPYDRFLAEHLAGDLLPPRRHPVTGANESVLATGWAFLGEEVHSPVDIRQDECERADNKLDVLTKTFLGLTLACARCHDHKFDPLTQHDYYALSGFILASSYRQVRFETDEEHARTAVELETLRARHRPALAAAVAGSLRPNLAGLSESWLAARLVSSNSAAPARPDDVAAATGIPSARLSAWAAQLASAQGDPAHPLHLFSRLSRMPDATSLAPEDFRTRLASLRPRDEPLTAQTRVLADFTAPGRTPWKTDGPVHGTRPRQAGEVIPGSSPTNPIVRVMPFGAVRRDPFWNRLALEPGTESESGSLDAPARAGRMIRTPTVQLDSGRLHYLLRGRSRVYAAVDSHIMVAGPLHGGLLATVDGGPEPSWVTHDLSAYAGHRAHLEFVPDGDAELEILLVVEAPEKPTYRPVAPWFPSAAPLPGSLRELASALEADLVDATRRLAMDQLVDAPRLATLADWLVRHRSFLSPPPPSPASTAPSDYFDYFDALDAVARRTRWTSRTAVAWFDGTGVDDRVLLRGKPSRPAEVAPRGLPAVLGVPPIAPPDSSGRAELARQLVDPANPLVARVLVNRIWQHAFGRGIVPTPDNFGFLGERPSHPELLDHLAWQFIHEDAWSIKRLVRRLVLTEAFARASTPVHPRADEADPDNTLLHRFPVRRLEAEAIRDAVLAVSGRFDPRLEGPPVPVHLTEFIVGRGRPERSGPLDGDGRRSIYTAVPRNFLPTMMVAFDFPTPFSTVGRRNTTNVPGQPLTLMNDPLLHDQARFWAARVIRTLPGTDDRTRIRWMFETAYARPPADDELRTCLESLSDLRALHAAAELPAWTDLAHALLTANEFIYLN